MVFVVIPTFNEQASIAQLLEAIFSQTDTISVLVVDDNSPDGTGRIVEKLQKQYSRLHLLRRLTKEGLGPAYLAGFQYALNHGADYVIQMDADFSHDPAMISRFLCAITSADVVLGSRYIVGGRVVNWNFFRRWISFLGNVYARFILRLPYRDLTGGYKCYKRKVIETLLSRQLSSVGYNFQIETTYWAHRLGYTITEIPITFTERIQGKSKFSFAIILESFFSILKLPFSRNN